MVTEQRPPHADRDDAAAVREVFTAAGYTADAIAARLGTTESTLTTGGDRPLYVRRLGSDDAMSVLIRLFLLDLEVPSATVDRCLGGAVDLLGRVGMLVAGDDGGVRAAVRAVPHEHLLIVSDRPGRDSADHVAAVHGPSATLAHLTVRRQVSTALDVGTGNGIQALLMASHAEHVVATDLNARALAFAEFNAAVNSVSNVELRLGSFLEPVAGERFDLVVANPPYIISPESELLFRDSGLPGDQVSETIVRALPDALADGGFATVMISWIDEGDGSAARPLSWLAESGCDVIAIHTATEDPLSSAARWNRPAQGDPDAYGSAIDRWTAYFDSHGIEAISFGALVLRRRRGANWMRSTRMAARGLAPAATHLERMFAATDLLRRVDDDALLATRLRVADDAVVDQSATLVDGRWARVDASIALSGGLRFSASLDDLTTSVVLALDGSRTLGEALAGVGEGDDGARVREIGLRVARQMLELGFLVAA